MFTGIVQEIGKVVSKTSILQGTKLGIKVPFSFLLDVNIGDSIALQGACMTVILIDKEIFYVDISFHSLITIIDMPLDSYINLEKAVQAHTFLGGHIVTGHVDCIALVNEFKQLGESWFLEVNISNINPIALNIGQYMAKKGSVTINGISLTINKVEDIQESTFIQCNLIPHTISATTMKYLKINDKVNIEIDIIARYIQRFTSFKSHQVL